MAVVAAEGLDFGEMDEALRQWVEGVPSGFCPWRFRLADARS
jgi:hypothetical protein